MHPLFEEGFADVDRATRSLQDVLAATQRHTKALSKAAELGDLPKLRQIVEDMTPFGPAVAEAVVAATRSWRLSANDEEEYLTDPDGYELELREAATAQGVRLDRNDDRLSAFPVLLKLQPSQRAIRIDAKRFTALRPSWVVARLRAAQGSKPKLTPDRFIEVLYDAYRKIVASNGGTTQVRLLDIHDLITLHPEMRKNYDKAEFTRDIHLLDRSGTNRTQKGLQLYLSSASSERSKKGVLTITAADGSLHNYSAIEFLEDKE